MLGSLRFDDDLHVELDVPKDQLKDIPWQYRDYSSVYNGQYSEELPPHRSFDHAIDMVEGEAPPWGPIYALSEKELEVLREYLDTMLKSGKIRPSKSPPGAPILFVPKKEGRCHGAEPQVPSVAQRVDRTPVLPSSSHVVAATTGSPSPMTQLHVATYGVGARMFEDMWAGRGCRRGRDRRGLGAA